jgi:hypothetical protein
MLWQINVFTYFKKNVTNAFARPISDIQRSEGTLKKKIVTVRSLFTKRHFFYLLLLNFEFSFKLYVVTINYCVHIYCHHYSPVLYNVYKKQHKKVIINLEVFMVVIGPVTLPSIVGQSESMHLT